METNIAHYILAKLITICFKDKGNKNLRKMHLRKSKKKIFVEKYLFIAILRAKIFCVNRA